MNNEEDLYNNVISRINLKTTLEAKKTSRSEISGQTLKNYLKIVFGIDSKKLEFEMAKKYKFLQKIDDGPFKVTDRSIDFLASSIDIPFSSDSIVAFETITDSLFSKEVEQSLENNEISNSLINLVRQYFSNSLEKKFNLIFYNLDYSDNREKTEKKDSVQNSQPFTGIVKRIKILPASSVYIIIMIISIRMNFDIKNITYSESKSKDEVWVKVEGILFEKDQKSFEISCTTAFLIKNLCPKKLLSIIVRIAVIESLERLNKDVYFLILSELVKNDLNFLAGKNFIQS